MKKHRVFDLFILVFCGLHVIKASSRGDEKIFEFTSSLYNLSIEENSVSSKYARSDNSTKIGVPLPEKDATCKFRVAEIVGEKSSLFKAHARQVGDFVFLRIRYKGDNPLNRELKEFYDMLVKATCKRKDSSNLETTTRIHLRVIDRNDASPVFLIEEQGYEATIDDTTVPFSKILQVEASDADIGINSAIYFSMLNRSHDFFVEPTTGWIRSLRALKAGKYEMEVKAEDRASRLFYFDENEVQPSWTAGVTIHVSETKRKQTKILVEKRKIDARSDRRQLAAILTLKDSSPANVVGISESELRHCFEVEKSSDEADKWMIYTYPGQIIPRGSNFTVSVGSDYSTMNAQPNVTAVISIEHVIEHSLRISGSERMEVNEMDPVGKIIGRVNAEIGDEQDQRLIRFSLRPRNATQKIPFQIGARNGIIRVGPGKLVIGSYEFDINASLQSLKIEAAPIGAIVDVIDGNDHPPVWSVKWLRQAPIAIPRSVKPGSVLVKVDAQDRDEAENGRVVYKMVGSSETPFEVDVDSGEVRLVDELAKDVSNWQITIWAIDWGSPLSRAAALNIVFYKNGTKVPPKPKPVVIVEGENKMTPQFESFPDVIDVAEDAPIGTVIAKIRATDDDAGYNGLVRYVIHDIPNVPDEVLSIDESTGEIRVASDLTKLMKNGKDYVELSLKVSAEDAGKPTKKSDKTLKLRILDVNNNAPQFEQPWYHIHVSEDATPGKQIIQLNAVDNDGSDNARIRYAISSFRENEDLIDIDAQSGIVKLKSPLDREQLDTHTFTVMAIDGGSPKKVSFVNLTIHVDDINDNPPRCVNLVTRARIAEDYPHGAFVTCVAASDVDLGQNARIRFSFDASRGEPFRIDHHTGCVFVHAPEEPLDYHKKNFYNISIDVADNGEQILSTNCELHIQLIDIPLNHLAVEFDDVAKEASVYENSPLNTEVIVVEAKELADEKRKARDMIYAIVGGDGQPYFNIDDKGVVRTRQPLDREQKPAYWLTIEARDVNIDSGRMRGANAMRRRAIVHVFVRILDRNDHRPQPRKPVYFASVKENSPANVVIVKVEASDADDEGNEAAPPLQYKIERGDPQSFFRIDATSGYMTTSGSRRLDREKQAEHELWVSVCDGGEPQLCSQVAVIVSVEDENDNAPAFTQPIHHYNVRAKYSGQLCRIFAVDMDDGENAQIFYNISEGDSRFSIDENGVISAEQPIHGDESYALTVQATDRGTPPQYAATRVVLTAIGGNRKSKLKNKTPVIAGKKSDYVIPISDADQVGLTIGKLEASDEDGDELWWSISSGNDNHTFDIRRDNGQLLLSKKVENLNRGELRLNVSVTDGVDWDHTTVIIQVSRSASNRPKFSASHYQTDISETTSVGTQIYTLKAIGEDIGPGTKPLVYSIFSIEDIAMEDKIRVEPSSGNVIVMEALDYEAAKRIRATVQVRQAGFKNFATLIVNINDENDNAPRFALKEEVAFVDESDVVESLVARVVAFDSDTGEHGIVSYSIVSGNEAHLFYLDSLTGEVRLAKKIDREQHVESILRIRAADNAKYSLSDEMTLYIRNSNVTIDEEVKFERKIYQIAVRDSTNPGNSLAVVRAQHHGVLRYSIVDPCPYFKVHSMSGAVYLSKWLTRERSSTKSVNCTVRAESGSNLFDETKVILKIVRTNQNAPIFRQQVYTANIRENSAIGAPVLLDDSSPLIVSADDRDSGPSGLVAYRIVAPGDEYFVVDLISGAVRARKPIDFEKIREWRFHVQAFDMGHPPRGSPMPALIIVSVIDENDEPPVFEKSSLLLNLLAPTADGVIIGSLKAKDVDTTGRIRYFMKDDTARRVFTINSTTGVVFVKNAAHLEAKEYKFEVFASDGIRSSSYEMIINVGNSSYHNDFRFAQDEYHISLIENNTYSQGRTLLAVSVISKNDIVNDVHYSILNERDEFSVHPRTGVIVLTGIGLDREVEQVIKLVVQGRDAENKIAQCTVVCKLEDVNDEQPRFMALPYNAAISLDAKIGDLVLNVKAKDDDEGENAKVRYRAPGLPHQFSMTNGEIRLAKRLSSLEEFKFEVIAEDAGIPKLESKEIVRIRAVDKAQPVFEKPVYHIVISANAVKKGDSIVTVRANSNIQDGLIGYRLKNATDAFSIDWNTGEIRLDKWIAKKSSEYRIEVEASEVTRPHLTATILVVVEVKLKKLDEPVFEQTQKRRIGIAESTAIGEKIFEIQMAGNEDVSFALNSDTFSIDVDTGEIRLARSLDFERKQQYRLRIAAANKRQIRVETELVVDVIDVNDEPPQFVSAFSSARIDDSALPGQFVTILSVTDLDTVSSLSSQDEKMLFKIVDGDASLFDVDSKTGEVTMARFIEPDDLSTDDREKTSKNLNVSVTDGIFTAYAQLSVEIVKSGKRQLPPRFEQSQYVANALENTAVNKSTLLTVSVREGIHPIRYSLGPAQSSSSGKSSWPVRIDKSSGRIHVSRMLNFHSEKLYHIPLVAEDAVGRRAFATLTLTVLDINDKPPVFVLSSYACSMSETAKEGDTVLMVSATDEDENDSIEYSLMDEGDPAERLFSVHAKQGTVTVAKKLEHKAGQTFSLTVKATDAANPPHHATTTLEINVAADGTAVPRFSNSHYVFSVSEDAAIGNVIGRVQQVDNDVGEVRFTIAEAPNDLPFGVERDSGKVIVRKGLDRERRARWRMAVRADAAGGVHTITTITVQVTDVNDNAPAFQGDYEKLSISEDSPIGTSVAIFSATDRDDAPSGKIRFSLLEDISQFVMNSESGWLIVAENLDREKQERYELVARATDEGGLNTDLRFTISVMDVNDSPPVFDKPEYEIDVEANTKEVLNITIRDADLIPNNISKLFISTGNEEGVFEIVECSTVGMYSIQVKRPELLSKKAEYRLQLRAFDGVFAINSKVLVRVKPIKELECPPDSIETSISEMLKKGTVVIEGSSLGSDSGYTFAIKEDKQLPFVINYRNGVVKLKESLDFELKDRYEFTRLTKSQKAVVCEEHVTVDVLDENDNPPKISVKSYNVSIKENLPASDTERKLVARIEAEDADRGSDLRFQLSPHYDLFRIDEKSGVITLIGMLDRENCSKYEMDVVVTDGKFEDTTKVLVEVADANDNPPVFEKKMYSMKVMESESVGYELTKVRADGGDGGETVLFSLKPSDNNRFVRLDPVTGVLVLADGLDFEKMKLLELVVIATDSGNPPLSTEARVNIEVMDENDNAPVFEKTRYSGSVKENSKIGEKVIEVKANDADSEHFGRVSYRIQEEPQNGNIPFMVDENGWIVVNGSIDYEKQKEYSFKIVAEDGGKPAMTSVVDVIIQLIDENDNSPVFEDCNMTAVVQEGATIGHQVVSVVVKDEDGPMNSGPFKIVLKGDGAGSFKVVGEQIVTATRLKHSVKDRFLLTVIASDTKGRSTDCPLTIWVKEESRHAPHMKPLRIKVNTLQNELLAGVIGSLNAFDDDAEDLLRFGIVEDSIRGPLPTIDTPRPSGKAHVFRVDANTGAVWAEHSIPAGLHTFNVTVTDGKFKTVSYVEVLVGAIDRDVVEHAVAIRIRDMTLEEFFTKHAARFRKVIAAHLNLQEDSVQLISVQQVTGGRVRRTSNNDIEILLTAQRGHGRGFLKPDHIYSRLKVDFQNIQDQTDGLRFQLITEVCTTGVCQRGECRERIELLEDGWTRSSVDGQAFVSPHHSRTAQCLCPDGYGGRRCELEVNKCSRSPCQQWQMCIPSGDHDFQCVCPLGMQGDRCDRPSCSNDGKCLEEAELSVGGDGYFEMWLSNEVETRMELEIEIKTSSTNGVIMWTAANADYHMLAIVDGHIEYTWDAGTGAGVVRSKRQISDGQWHRIGISRRQRRTRITVDDSDVQEAFSPIGAMVLNLHRYSQKLVFGAKVEEGEDTEKRVISHGISACFRTISIDGRNVPKTRQGLRLFGAQPGCAALTSSPCGEMPCGNGGTCVPHGKHFTCLCSSRYTGDRCEIDAEPCSSHPCPPGIQCIPFFNDYLCKCPDGFTGKHCESRGFSTDVDSPCGDEGTEKCGGGGQCIALPRHSTDQAEYICNCTGGILQSEPCQEKLAILDILLRIEIIAVLIGLGLLGIISFCVCVICRFCKRNSDPKYGAHCDVPHMRNTRVLMPAVDPPPLPPRGYRGVSSSNGFMSSSAMNTSRPMVQVRPFSNQHRAADSRSPSVCGSGKAKRGNDGADLSASNRARKSDRRSEREYNDALTGLRDGGGSSLEDWRTSIDDNINAAIRTGVEGRVLVVGQTELRPVVNDDDYMTMKPVRKIEKTPPKVPAHAAPPPSVLRDVGNEMETSVLYDEPISSNEVASDTKSIAIDDIDGSDIEEVRIHIS